MKSAFLSDIIDTEQVKVRIVNRQPESYSANVNGIVNVQVQTFGNPGAMCPDYIIVLRGTGLSHLNERGKIYAYAVTDTSYFNDCLSISSLIVPKGFLNSWFDIEVYEKGYTEQEIESGIENETFFSNLFNLDRTIEPIAVLKEQLLWDLPIEAEKKGFTGSLTSGINSISNPLTSVNSFMRTAGTIAIVGVGVYFLLPLFPDLRQKVKKALK